MKEDTKSSTINMNDDAEDVKDLKKSKPSIKTELSIHPDWHLKPEQTYVFKFHNNSCPALYPNQLSLYGIDLEKEEESENVKVTAFIRSTIEKGITLGQTTLLLLGQDGVVIGKKTFDLSEAGEIPPRSSRPWQFEFEPKDLSTQELPFSNWKLAFELKKPHQLDLAESWKQSLADADKEKLEQLVSTLKAPKPGEINFMGLQAQIAEDGQLHVTLLIRNGSEKTVNVENLPLQIQDARGDVVAKGGFTLKELEIKANTSKPWTFIFPKELLLKEEIDLSQWKAEPIPSADK